MTTMARFIHVQVVIDHTLPHSCTDQQI